MKGNKSIGLDDVIAFFGTHQKLADALGINRSNVAHWIKGRYKIPLHHASKIQEITKGKIMVAHLRPDIVEYFD